MTAILSFRDLQENNYPAYPHVGIVRAKARLNPVTASLIYTSIPSIPISKIRNQNRRKYPKNWRELTFSLKESVDWRCSCCGKRCYKPGERPEHLSRSEWTANILQVHHRNHNPSENQLSNLQCVCAACHLNLHRSRISPVSPGQSSLF